MYANPSNLYKNISCRLCINLLEILFKKLETQNFILKPIRSHFFKCIKCVTKTLIFSIVII